MYNNYKERGKNNSIKRLPFYIYGKLTRINGKTTISMRKFSKGLIDLKLFLYLWICKYYQLEDIMEEKTPFSI